MKISTKKIQIALILIGGLIGGLCMVLTVRPTVDEQLIKTSQNINKRKDLTAPVIWIQ